MIIDFYAHYISKRVSEGKHFAYPSQNADPEIRLGLMEKYGIDMQAISQTVPVLLGFNAEDSARICRISNDDNYALCKAYPDKFVNICMISLLDMKSAMEEFDRSINELDCRGITVATNQQGKGLDSSEYFPFYEKLVEHDLPLLLHPINWESYPLIGTDTEWGSRMMVIFGWPFDTTQAVWRMIFGGVIDRFPSIKIVMHHLGAMLPYFARRIEQNFNKYLKNKFPRHITEYWGNLYGDTAMDGTVAAFPCGYAFFGPDRMIFGTDYPFGPEAGEDFVRDNLAGVKAMNIPKDNMERILSGNARRLLKIH